MKRRLLRSVAGTILATVLALGLPLGIVSWQLIDDGAHRRLAEKLEAIDESLARMAADTGTVDLRRLDGYLADESRLTYQPVDGPGQVIGAPAAPGMLSVDVVSVDAGLLTLAIPPDERTAEQIRAVGLIALTGALSLVVGLCTASITARRLTRPLSDLADRAARLGGGDFRVGTRRYRIAELDRVADVLDAVAGDIANLIGREQELAGDISHQVRTGLTGLQLRLEELTGHEDPLVRREVGETLEQTDRLVDVVNDLLADARSQRASGAAVIELREELADLVDQWQPNFTAAGRELTVGCPPAVRVRATGVRLREALGILVDNALTHGAGTVTVTVHPARPWVRLEVADEGPGVDPALVGHIFERGVSGSSSSGLGLGLARAFIEADGGRLELRRAAPPLFVAFLVEGDIAGGDIVEGDIVEGDIAAEPGGCWMTPDPPSPADTSGSPGASGTGSMTSARKTNRL